MLHLIQGGLSIQQKIVDANKKAQKAKEFPKVREIPTGLNIKHMAAEALRQQIDATDDDTTPPEAA